MKAGVKEAGVNRLVLKYNNYQLVHGTSRYFCPILKQLILLKLAFNSRYLIGIN